MSLPNFLIVGAQKSGTTTLHEILQLHPQANMSQVKEVNYFTSEYKLSKGKTFYSSFFSEPKNNQLVIGESSPGYMCYPGAASMIRETLGHIKIVMILRDPVVRAFSQYWDNRRHLSESLEMDAVIDRYLTDVYEPGSRGYFSRGVYIKYIEEYLKYFSRDNIHIMILEEFVRDPARELQGLFEFLGLDSSPEYLQLRRVANPSMVWNNPLYAFVFERPKYTKLIPKHGRRLFFWGARRSFRYPLPTDEQLTRLSDFYRPWNEALRSFLGKDLACWNPFSSNKF